MAQACSCMQSACIADHDLLALCTSTGTYCWSGMQALTTHDAGGTAACLLARVHLQRGGAATIAWRLLSPCLPAAWCIDPHAVLAVLSQMFEQGEYQQVRLQSAVTECWSVQQLAFGTRVLHSPAELDH